MSQSDELDLSQFAGFVAGPWHTREDHEDEQIVITCKARRGKATIAVIDVGYDEPFESEQREGAKLIAAAPALLDEVKRLRAELWEIRHRGTTHG